MKTTTLTLLISTLFLITQAGVIESTTHGRVGRKSQDCKKLGLCLNTEKSESSLKFLFRYDDRQAYLELIISFDDLKLKQSEALVYFENQSKVDFEEAIELPESLCMALKINKRSILPGRYVLQRDGIQYKIRIPIQYMY